MEVRDKGVLKKKIRTNNRSFNEVLADVETYFVTEGKLLPPGVLKGTLEKIGLPQVKMIIADASDLSATLVPTPVARESIEKPKPKEQIASKPPEGTTVAAAIPKANAVEASGKAVPAPAGVVSGTEFKDIEEALSAVESLSDSFLAPKSALASTTEKPGIKIEVSGTEEILGTPKTRTPGPIAAEEKRLESAKATPQSQSVPGVAAGSPAATQTAGRVTPPEAAASTRASGEGAATIVQPRRPGPAPSRIIKPIVTAKALILGEEGVGKSSLMQRAGLKPMDEPENEADKKPYISERTIELDAHRVRLQVWSFDTAVNCKITRKSFYDSTGVVIIVYSTSDRWSFDSVEFWLKESMAVSGQRPPMVIVGNKTDLRAGALLTSREPPVSQEEGLKLAEDIAVRLGSAEKLHPVAFIETSCLTGQGVDDVFRTAAELYIKVAGR
ncbi:MAG: hypothetical protein C4K49_02145 [Candidatus Thorarchaeota archaeon]|nr:MAG: hypothetical protein C4K49_02145 [Candidatus Thorarchaeota archaeon]